MNIELKRNYSYELVFSEENIKVVEDIESRIYTKKEDGKIDLTIPAIRDIKTEALEQFSCILEEMIYYRNAEFNSSDLIKQLFDKLPKQKANELVYFLKNNYED